jgi:hybrid cluster-associated redox disulfide protein
MVEITKDMLIGDAIQAGNQEAIAQTLLGIGMHCFGCAIARGETIAQAAEVHGVDVDKLVEDLNKAANS